MSATDSEAAVDRLATRIDAMTDQERARYLFLALAILGWNTPDVLNFILDRADEKVSDA